MDFRRIDLLVQVAEYGSFSKAASVIGIAQPALGRQIRKLEEECGTPLLYRHGRGVLLTAEGEQLLARVRPLLKQMESAVTELSAERESPSGTVVLGLTPTLCRLIGQRLVTEARRLYPSLRLNIVMAYSGYVLEWLTGARLDIAVVHDTRRAQHLLMEHIGDLQLSLISPAAVVRPGKPKPLIKLQELQGLPLVLPTTHHGLRRTMEHAASKAGITLTVEYEMDALEVMLDLVKEGHAHTVLAAPVVADWVSLGYVVTRQITEPTIATGLVLAKAANRPATRATRVIEAMLKDLVMQAAKLPA